GAATASKPGAAAPPTPVSPRPIPILPQPTPTTPQPTPIPPVITTAGVSSLIVLPTPPSLLVVSPVAILGNVFGGQAKLPARPAMVPPAPPPLDTWDYLNTTVT